MTELQGAVALAQLDRLEWICARRNAYGDAITAGIAGLKGISPHLVKTGDKSSYWFYLLRVDEKELGVSRDGFTKALAAEGISCGAGYIPACVYEYDLFKYKNAYPGTDCPWGCKYYNREIEYKTGDCPVAEEILKTSVRVNINEFYTNDDIDDIIKGINKVANYYVK
jgi:dTDP-4-amino-4,6-dideoxygalactose transaminase